MGSQSAVAGIAAIRYLFWIDIRDMLADGLNKGAITRKPQMQSLVEGIWKVLHPFISRFLKAHEVPEFEDDEPDFGELEALEQQERFAQAGA